MNNRCRYFVSAFFHLIIVDYSATRGPVGMAGFNILNPHNIPTVGAMHSQAMIYPLVTIFAVECIALTERIVRI